MVRKRIKPKNKELKIPKIFLKNIYGTWITELQ